jgi:hypothetical protein
LPEPLYVPLRLLVPLPDVLPYVLPVLLPRELVVLSSWRQP